MNIKGSTKQAIKATLTTTKEQLEKFGVFDPKTVSRVMKILEADIWCQYWTKKREELLNKEN